MSQFISHPLQETMGDEAWKQLKHDIQYGKISWPVGVEIVKPPEDIPPRVPVNFCSEAPRAIGLEGAIETNSNAVNDLSPIGDIITERGKVYGDPRENHEGIAMQWAPMLQPHWEAIRDMKPLPPHVVALLMVLVKVNRMRLVFHEDNFQDADNYLSFAQEWQRVSDECHAHG